MLFRLKGPLSFGAAKGISERMMLVRQYRILLLDITNVPHLGVTASLAIERMVQEAVATRSSGARGRRSRESETSFSAVWDSVIDRHTVCCLAESQPTSQRLMWTITQLTKKADQWRCQPWQAHC